MSKKNDDFFVKKKLWSEIKDGLLGCYLKPYVSKILHTHKPLAYVDCFAGKGRFEDGSPGSPLIALDIFRDSLTTTRTDDAIQIGATFIDVNYARDLKFNLSEYPSAEIVAGSYENVIDELLESKAGCNVFLYIDPYGIKALDCSKFDAFANGKFHTIELLINMNSFGFIREACNVMGTKLKVDESGFFDELVEYESTVLDATDKSIEALNRIAGGEYWKDIIIRYKNKEIDGYKAEEYFSEQYCKRLRRNYKYVLNMPIRIQKKQHPKYRMIHATNHPNGCTLMVDNICNRWEVLKDIQSNGQMNLFEENFNNQIIDESQLEAYVKDFVSQYDDWKSLTEVQADFFVSYGAICKTRVVANILRKMENNKQIEIRRKPKFTGRGKLSTFMTEGHGNTVSLKWVK